MDPNYWPDICRNVNAKQWSKPRTHRQAKSCDCLARKASKLKPAARALRKATRARKQPCFHQSELLLLAKEPVYRMAKSKAVVTAGVSCTELTSLAVAAQVHEHELPPQVAKVQEVDLVAQYLKPANKTTKPVKRSKNDIPPMSEDWDLHSERNFCGANGKLLAIRSKQRWNNAKRAQAELMLRTQAAKINHSDADSCGVPLLDQGAGEMTNDALPGCESSERARPEATTAELGGLLAYPDRSSGEGAGEPHKGVEEAGEPSGVVVGGEGAGEPNSGGDGTMPGTYPDNDPGSEGDLAWFVGATISIVSSAIAKIGRLW